MSVDPALEKYIPRTGEDNSNLPAGGVLNTVNLNVYHYGNNNPIKYNDPDGEIALIPLAIVGGLIGAATSVASTVVKGMLTDNPVSKTELISSAVGGFVSGAVATTTGNAALAGGASSFAENVTTQLIENGGKLSDVDWGDAIVTGGKGAATGFVAGKITENIKLDGFTGGKGSFKAVDSQIRTKLDNKTIKNITVKTAAKMGTYQNLGDFGAGEAISIATDKLQEGLSPKEKPPTKTSPPAQLYFKMKED